VTELTTKILETKLVYWSIKTYTVLMDLIVGFLAAALVFELLGVPLLFAIIPGMMYALVQLMREYLDSSLVAKLEGKYDNLDQRLATAMEYQGTKNVIVEDLLTDVTKRIDNVETSTFLNSGALSKKVYSIVIMSFMLLTATVLDLRSVAFDALGYVMDSQSVQNSIQQLSDKGASGFETLMGERWEKSNWTDDKTKEKLGAQPGGDRPGVSEGPIPGKGSGTGADAGKDIYGKASSASVQGKDVDFRLHPEYGGDIEIRETSSRNNDRLFRMDDVQSVEECVDCVVGPEHEEVVRKYFEKILPET